MRELGDGVSLPPPTITCCRARCLSAICHPRSAHTHSLSHVALSAATSPHNWLLFYSTYSVEVCTCIRHTRICPSIMSGSMNYAARRRSIRPHRSVSATINIYIVQANRKTYEGRYKPWGQKAWNRSCFFCLASAGEKKKKKKKGKLIFVKFSAVKDDSRCLATSRWCARKKIGKWQNSSVRTILLHFTDEDGPSSPKDFTPLNGNIKAAIYTRRVYQRACSCLWDSVHFTPQW